MHLVELIPARQHRSGAARRPRNIPGHHARQGRGPRQGHAELHRQPHRRVLDAGDDAPHGAVRARLRHGRRADRARDRPPQERDLPHRRRGRPRHDGARHQDDGRHAAGRSVASVFATPPVLAGAGRARARSGQKTGAASTARSARTSRCSTWRRGTTAQPRAKSTPRSPRSSRSRIRPRNSRSCARSAHPQAQFLWAIFRDLFHYSAYHLADIADTARDVDLAIRWGYGWKLGPFETWQAAGWKQVAGWIAEDIAAGKAMSNAPLPGMGDRRRRARRARRRRARIQPARDDATCRARRCRCTGASCFPDPLLGERLRHGHDGVRERRRAHVARGRRHRASSSFKSKLHTIGDEVLDGMQRAIDERRARIPRPRDLADRRSRSRSARTSRGRAGLLQAGQCGRDSRRMVANFQATSAADQVLAGADGRRGARPGARRRLRIHDACGAHGCGARKLHRPGRSRRRPAARRRRLQGIRGARRAGSARGANGGRRSFAVHAHVFRDGRDGEGRRQRARSEGTGLAAPGRRRRVQRATNCCTSPRQQARALAEAGYRPPLPPRDIPVAGDIGIATFKMLLVNMLEGGFISPHDFEIGTRIAARAVRRRRRRGQPGRRGMVARARAQHFMELLRRRRRRRSASRTCSRPASRCGTEQRAPRRQAGRERPSSPHPRNRP